MCFLLFLVELSVLPLLAKQTYSQESEDGSKRSTERLVLCLGEKVIVMNESSVTKKTVNLLFELLSPVGMSCE